MFTFSGPVTMQEPTLALELIDPLNRKLLSRNERALIREISGEIMLAPSGIFWDVPAAQTMPTPTPRKLNPPGVTVLEYVPAPTPQPRPAQKLKLNQIGRTQVASFERARQFHSRDPSILLTLMLLGLHCPFTHESQPHGAVLELPSIQFHHLQGQPQTQRLPKLLMLELHIRHFLLRFHASLS